MARKNKGTATAPTHFRMMAEFWEIVADGQRKEWEDAKFIKQVNGGPGHRSKAEFEKHRMFVYQSYKLSLHRAALCRLAADEIETGEVQDYENAEPDGALKRSGQIILGTFKNLLP